MTVRRSAQFADSTCNSAANRKSAPIGTSSSDYTRYERLVGGSSAILQGTACSTRCVDQRIRKAEILQKKRGLKNQ
jgi:hypothetical protein